MDTILEQLRLLTDEGLSRLAARHPTFDDLIRAEMERRRAKAATEASRAVPVEEQGPPA